MKKYLLFTLISAMIFCLCSARSQAVTFGNGTPDYTAPPDVPKPTLYPTEYYPSSDDAAGIQAAIDAANAAGGGTVVLGTKTYTINSPITLKSNVSIAGAGIGNTILKRRSSYADSGSTGYFFGGNDGTIEDFEIRKLTLDGDYTNEELRTLLPEVIGLGIWSGEGYYNQRLRVYKVEIKGFQMGIHVKGTSEISLEDCKIHDNGGTYLYHNIYYRRVGMGLIENCEIYNSVEGSGLKLAGGTQIVPAESRYFTIIGNNMYNNERINLNIQGCDHLLIEDNVLESQYSTVSKMAGLYLVEYNGYECQYTDIINNTIINNINNGIYIEGCNTFSIAGNACADNGTNYNINSSSDFDCDYNTSSDNSEIQVINAGVGGNSTSNLLSRIDTDVLAHSPDTVIMMIGTNDMLNSGKLATLEQYEINLRNLADQILAYNSELILMTIPHCIEELLFTRHDPSTYEPDGPNGRVDLANQVVTQVAAEKNAILVDVFSLFDGRVNTDVDSLIVNLANSGNEDGVHPTTEGFEVMVDAIYPAIIENQLPTNKIICFGDSITARNYPDLLYDRLLEGEPVDPNDGTTPSIGDIITHNLGTDTLSRWEADSTLVWETTGIPDSYQVEIGPDENVYLGGWTSGVIRVYDVETGSFLSSISVSGNRVLDFRFAGNGDLYVTTNDPSVSLLTSASGYTTQSTFATGMFTSNAYSLDLGTDVTGDGVSELYVLDGGASGTSNNIRVIDGVTATLVNSWQASLVDRPWDLVCGSDGRVYVGGRNNATIGVWNADGTGGQSITDAAGISYPYQLAEGASGTWYVANRSAVTGTTNAAATLYTDNFAVFDSVLTEDPTDSNFTGIAVISSPYNGDLTFDGKVNLEDIAKLSKDWQPVYMMDNLLDIANDWLSGAIE